MRLHLIATSRKLYHIRHALSTIVDAFCQKIGYPCIRDGDIMGLDTKVIGQIIREKRLQKGMTQELLSGFAGIARTHLTMIENGSKKANFDTIWRIAIALDMKPSELVAEIENAMNK